MKMRPRRSGKSLFSGLLLTLAPLVGAEAQDVSSAEYWKDLRAKAFEAWRKTDAELNKLQAQLLIPVMTDGRCPLNRIYDELADQMQACRKLGDEALSAVDRKQPKRAEQMRKKWVSCVKRYNDQYFRLLPAKYSRADFAAVAAEMGNSDDQAKLECLLGASHNAAIRANIAAQKARAEALRDSTIGLTNRGQAMTGAIAQEQRPPAETHEDDSGKKLLRGLGIVFQGVGQGLTGSSGRHPAPATHTDSAGCLSDYSCQHGERCVKAPYQNRGYCAREVNQYGTPTYSPPDSNSVYPGGQGQCGFDTDCPVGFYCAIQSGALRGACLRR
jgi:hypothetical protein